MKRILFGLVLCLLITVTAAWAEDEPMKVFVGATKYGKPCVFRDKGGNADGHEGDMWREIVKRANLDVEFKYNSFAALCGLLDNGEIELVIHFVEGVNGSCSA